MKDKCTVYNKSAGHVVYRLPELGLRRQFYPREAKKDILSMSLKSWRKHLAAAN